MRRIRVTGPARRDIAGLLQRSVADFGSQARERYKRLIDEALRDLGDDVARLGVQPIDDIRAGYFLYHLEWSRKGSAGQSVRQPRHLIAFYIDDTGAIIVARVFHERQLLGRHLANNEND
jgi:toxin ParE1/3/4